MEAMSSRRRPRMSLSRPSTMAPAPKNKMAMLSTQASSDVVAENLEAMEGRATTSPKLSMLMGSITIAMAATTHQQRVRSDGRNVRIRRV